LGAVWSRRCVFPPLPVYARQGQVFGRLMANAIKAGDDPSVVAEVVAVAATDPKPRLRYTAGRARILRFVPAWAVDRQIRKVNALTG
jgi:hypothetical protein